MRCSRSDCRKELTKLEQEYNFRTAFPLCRRCHRAQDMEHTWRALDAREDAEGAGE